jgi:hypothetical protein
MDPYPQQSEDYTMIHKFYKFLKDGKLTTTKCTNCGKVNWPPKIVCPACMSDNLDWIELSKSAKIRTYTIQEGGVPAGFKAPMIFAVIEFPEGVSFIATVDCKPEEIDIGKEVELNVYEIPNDPHPLGPRVMFNFKLK